MSGRREMLQPTADARKALEDTCFALYLEGKTSPGSKLWYDCIGDPWVYGSVIVRIQDYIKQKQQQKQDESATKVSCESDSSTKASAGEVNTEIASAVPEDRPRKRKTRSKPTETSQVKTRSKVRAEARLPYHGLDASQEDVSRHGRRWNPCERTCCLRFFWEPTQRLLERLGLR